MTYYGMVKGKMVELIIINNRTYLLCRKNLNVYNETQQWPDNYNGSEAPECFPEYISPGDH